jgi:SAM-dependent methyltransferase
MRAPDYDAWYDTPRGRWIGDAEYRLVSGLLGAPSTVLDVGCGTGWFARRLAADGARVTGLDPDEEALAFARHTNRGRVAYVRGDARRLPFADGAFDAVVSVTALCFIEQWERAIGEIVRVSRGTFALGLLHRHSLLWLRKGRGGGRGAYRGARWHIRAEIEAALGGLPVRNVRHAYAIFVPSGSVLARAAERLLPRHLPLGAFLAIGGEVARPARRHSS